MDNTNGPWQRTTLTAYSSASCAQVLDFLQALFSCPEQALVASLLPTDYFVHLHSLGFLRAYHALPGAAGQPSGVKRMSASGSGGQPQLQLCMGHLKASAAGLAICHSDAALPARAWLAASPVQSSRG